MIWQRLGKYFIRRMATAHGFLDPMTVIAKLNRFSQPSEVLAPTELLRAGAIFHVRGLMNSQAIQHNLDWVWPFWVERQFDPQDPAFVPRAFSATHINLTHRNWTAIGLSDYQGTPIIDPAGLVTPFWDGWSLDYWIIDATQRELIPSRMRNICQRLQLDHNLSVLTRSYNASMELLSKVQVIENKGEVMCKLCICSYAKEGGWLIVSLRPYNPEGISFIKTIELMENKKGWKINNKQYVYFHTEPERFCLSNYREGDVYFHLRESDPSIKKNCDVEMITAAAIFPIQPDESKEISLDIPLEENKAATKKENFRQGIQMRDWSTTLQGACQLKIPNQQFQFLYDAALRTLLLHTVEDIVAGPYTYKRFWFRDAVFIVHALLCTNFVSRAEKLINRFLPRQTIYGYFMSQEGEWDANGEVLWILRRFCQMANQIPPPEWQKAIRKGARWIMHKRLPKINNYLHGGLMPPGFSAEHFGPNDYYYWDDFWSVAGLQAAGYLSELMRDKAYANHCFTEADDLMDSIKAGLGVVEKNIKRRAIPASPYRRMDSGAVGSLVAGYPLKILPANDCYVMGTVDYLMENCLVSGGLFHDMSHSGINPYLTLHIAQVLLRAGDQRFHLLTKAIADLASPTGQWPEAIHPLTKGGCMGDGQHVWAAAEWIMMLRNCFVREEENGKRLVLLSGIPEEWYQHETEIVFGPAPTTYGTISLKLQSDGRHLNIDWQGCWHEAEPHIEINLPKTVAIGVMPGCHHVALEMITQ